MSKIQKLFSAIWIVGFAIALTGGAHFFFFIFGERSIFELTMIGKIPSSLAFIMALLGGAMVLLSQEGIDRSLRKNNFVSYDKPLDRRTYFTFKWK